MFIKNCRNNYNLSTNVTTDEQLLSFRGRFSAKVYIKSKSARYKIKIVNLNDAEIHYLFNDIPYMERVTTRITGIIPSYYVRLPN